MALGDVTHLRRALDGNDVDAWDPDYIRRVLPLWRAVLCNYFRAEVRGLDNIPERGPALLVGNHSGGTYIADTFIFATQFYSWFGPERLTAFLVRQAPRELVWPTCEPPRVAGGRSQSRDHWRDLVARCARVGSRACVEFAMAPAFVFDRLRLTLPIDHAAR